MLSGGVRGARGQGRGDGEVREGDAGDGDELPDAVLEALISDVEAEDDVAGIFGDFDEEEEVAQGAAAGSADQRPPAEEAAAEWSDAAEEVPPPPNPALPICPSQEDWDEHFRTHINFRAWCPVCV